MTVNGVDALWAMQTDRHRDRPLAVVARVETPEKTNIAADNSIRPFKWPSPAREHVEGFADQADIFLVTFPFCLTSDRLTVLPFQDTPLSNTAQCIGQFFSHSW
jgi:hypothetical protein